jgi:hypothetical protein
VQNKIIILASVRAASAMDEEDTIDLMKILDYINIRVETFKRAVNLYKHGGNQGNVHDMLAEMNM